MNKKNNLLLKLERISKRFGPVQALNNIDLDVYSGEVIALLGDNGSGKSTLIKIICGFHKADTGNIYFEGEHTKWGSPYDSRKKGIEVVYQDFALLPLMGVTRNFFLGKEIVTNAFFNSLNIKKMNEETKKALVDIGINIKYINLLVGKLSGGQRQSIAISRSLYFGTKILILDEPTASLSIKETKIVLETIRKVAERGLAVIFISHNVNHVYSVSDRFVVLYHGNKVMDIYKKEITPEGISNTIVTGNKDKHFSSLLNY